MKFDVQIKVTLGITVITTVGVLCTVLVVSWSMPDVPESRIYDKICLPDITENGIKHDLKCGDSVEELHRFIQQTIANIYGKLEKDEKEEERKTEKENRPLGLKQFMRDRHWEMKPAARFTGMPQTRCWLNKDDCTGCVPIREWRHGRELYDNGGFKRYGIKYVNGRIVVPVGGIYQIYSFLDMYEPCIEGTGIPDVRNRSESIKHSIFKFNIVEGHDTELISAVQPHLKSANLSYNIYSSFIMSIIELRAGDELTVKVSNMTYLKYPDVNYFGINFISMQPNQTITKKSSARGVAAASERLQNTWSDTMLNR